MDAATDEKKPPTDLWSVKVPTRYHTVTFPPAHGGGDVVLRDPTTEEFLDNIDSADERAMRAVYAFRGAKVGEGLDREKWWRSLPEPVTKLIVKYSTAFLTSESEVVEVKPGARGRRWVLGGEHVVELCELVHGEVFDVKSSALSPARKQAALAAKSVGRDIADKLLALPAYRGVKVLDLYNTIHAPTAQEEIDFFSARVVTTTAPPIL